MCLSYVKLLSTGVPAALAEKVYWVGRQLEERRVNNSFVTRTFLEGTQVKEEVEKRMMRGDW